MKKIFFAILMFTGLVSSSYSQCAASVYAGQLCNGEVLFYFSQNFFSSWDAVTIDSDYGDGVTAHDSTGVDTIMTAHIYPANGTYSAIFNLTFYDSSVPGSTCTTTVNTTVVITNVLPPVSTCAATFTPVQYCMDSISFVPDFGPVPCGHTGEIITAFTPSYDTLGYLGVPVTYSPWPDSITIHYGYFVSGSPYLYCITTVAIPTVTTYQLDLFADTSSLPDVTLHDTSSTNMYFYSIQWGDGTDMNYLNQSSYTHTYLIDGTYMVHADGVPASMFSYFVNDSMPGSCLTYDSIAVVVTGASTNLSCNLQPEVHYDLTSQTLDFRLTYFGQLVTSPNLDVNWSFSNGMTSTDDFGTIGSVNPGPASFTVDYVIYDVNSTQTCTASVTNSVNNIYPSCNALVYIYEDSIPGIFWADDQSSGGLPPYSYTWDYGDGYTSNLQYPPSHVYNTPGLYMICLTITDSQTPPCSSTYCDTADARAFSPMSQLNVHNPSTGIEDFSAIDFVVYPNPATEWMMMRIPDNVAQLFTVSVYTVTGQQVYSKKFTNTGTLTLDLADLPPGAYFIRLNDGLVSGTRKFIRQ